MPGGPHLRYETPEGCSTIFIGEWNEAQQRVVYDRAYTNQFAGDFVVAQYGPELEGAAARRLLAEFQAWQKNNPPKAGEAPVKLSQERVHKDTEGELVYTFIEPHAAFASTGKDEEGRSIASPAHRCGMEIGQLKPLISPTKMALNSQASAQTVV